MPAPSRWMIRCSLLYLLVGFMIGALMFISKAWPVYPQVWIGLPVHIEILIFGWIIQFTMGTAYWILPRYLVTEDRGNSSLTTAMVMLFNGGVLVNVLTYLNVIPQWFNRFRIIDFVPDEIEEGLENEIRTWVEAALEYTMEEYS